MIIPRALHKSADAEKIKIKLQVTDIYISNFSQVKTNEAPHKIEIHAFALDVYLLLTHVFLISYFKSTPASKKVPNLRKVTNISRCL